jgi:hypothetical protein
MVITTSFALISHVIRHYLIMAWASAYKKSTNRNMYTFYNETMFGEQELKRQVFSEMSVSSVL